MATWLETLVARHSNHEGLVLFISISGMETSTGLSASKVYVGPVEILSGLVKFPITSIQISGLGADYGIWELSSR